MKLGLGLDVRKASAPAFKGLLDKFTGAVAAYSTRKLTASQPNILPADYGDGAAAAYSLRKVKASYSGNCIDVRRSSDNTTSSIGFSGNELDTTALEAFVNEEVTDDINTTTDSNADGLADGLTTHGNATYSIVTGNGHSGSAQRVDFNPSGGTLQTFAITTLPPIIGQEITISFMYRSNFTITSIGNGYSSAGTAFEDIPANTGDAIRFEAKAVWSPTGGSDGRVQPMWLRNAGEFIEISDWSVTYHTADGFVTKWYDQSGNENDATQGTDNDQPQIIDAGSTILENGKPAIQFDGVDDYLTGAAKTTINNTAIFAVIKSDSNTQDATFIQNTLDGSNLVALGIGGLGTDNEIGSRLNVGGSTIDNPGDSTFTATDQTLVSFLADNTAAQMFVDGTEETDSVSCRASNLGTAIGARGDGLFPFDGAIQEVIFFDSDQSSNRQDIEWNINNHYNIYTDSWDKQSAMEVRRAIDNETTNIGFAGKDLDTTALESFASESSPVLDDYTGAAAAYSLRKVRSAYTGSAVRVRRSSDNELQDIGFDANGDLDTTALLAFVNADVDTYTSDFSSGIDGLAEVRVTASSVDGISDGTTSKDDVLQSVLTSGSNTHSVRKNSAFDLSNTYNVSFEYYIPSAQTIDSLVVRTGTGSDGTYTFSVVGSWESETIENWSPSANSSLSFHCAVGGNISAIDADGDVYYLKNIVVTQTTADGAVTTWYDQSGNGNDATNSTESEQPLIVDGGTLVTENSKAALDFDGVDDLLTFSTVSDPECIILVTHTNYVNTYNQLLRSNNSNLIQRATNNIEIRNFDGTSQILASTSNPYTDNSDFITFINNSGTTVSAYVNSVLAVSGVGNYMPSSLFEIGGSFNGRENSDLFQEVILYPSDQSVNRTGIEGNIGRYYNIDGFRDVFVTKWYDQSGNFNHAENSTETEQPQIVDGGTLVEENGKPSVRFDNSVTYNSLEKQFASALSQPVNIFGVVQNNDGDKDHFYDGYINRFSFGYDNTNLTINAGNSISAGAYTTGLKLISNLYNTTGSELNINGVTETSGNVGTNTMDGIVLGTLRTSLAASIRTDYGLNGNIQEIIIFNSDQSSNLTDIENNINKHFKIYE